MKKKVLLAVFLGLTLFGCGTDAENMQDEAQMVEVVETHTGAEDSFYRIKADMKPVEQTDFSEKMQQEILAEWERYQSLSAEERMMSSHLWGTCGEKLDEWTDCEDLLGFSVENPLEDAVWLEKANYFAMALNAESLSAENRNHIALYWSGEANGEIRQADIQTGYLDGENRISLMATAVTAEEYETEAAWAEEVTFAYEILEMAEGEVLLVTPENSGEYDLAEAYFVQGNILYHISVTGEEGQDADVRETMEKVLKEFYS